MTRNISAPTTRVDPDGTYVISGGLGGLGRHLAIELAGWGARHLILLGRRGPDSEAKVDLSFALMRARSFEFPEKTPCMIHFPKLRNKLSSSSKIPKSFQTEHS